MIKMNRMVVIDGIRYKPADAERLGHKAFAPAQPIVLAPVVEEAYDEEELVLEPSKAGSKTAWINFAKFQGATDEQIDGMSRDELAETYGA